MTIEPDIKSRSPWAALHGIETLTISPANKLLNKSIRIPGSKSYSNRALLIAAAANGRSYLSGLLKSDDSYWCLECIKELGIKAQFISEDELVIEGKNLDWPNKNRELYIGSAGTTARFLPGILAASRSGEWSIDASTSMLKRPVSGVVKALQDLGAIISYRKEDGFLPITIQASELKGGSITMSGSTSSQYISGALICAALNSSRTIINISDEIVQRAYIDITIELMKKFGAQVSRDCDFKQFIIEPTGFKGGEIKLEADVSTSCYFFALAALTGEKITIENLNIESLQPDIEFLEILKKLGCLVTHNSSGISVQGPTKLKGGFEIDMKKLSDQTMTLAVLACFADDDISIRNVAHIRHHECDRISAICAELNKGQIKVVQYQDGLRVSPGTPKSVEFDSYDDHRLAMSLSLIGSKVSNISIKDPGCVSKTCPQYFEILKKLGLVIEL